MMFPIKSACLYCDKELDENCPHFFLDTTRKIRINFCPPCAVKMLIMTGVFSKEQTDKMFSV